MDAITVHRVSGFVPKGLVALAGEADAEGIRNVRRVVERWESGEERFDRPEERLLVAAAEPDEIVGVGGLTVCPTIPDAFRVRRFYVHPAWRRRGVAGALASRLLEQWPRGASAITCNAQASAAAPKFWEAMGFEPVSEVGITHILRGPNAPKE